MKTRALIAVLLFIALAMPASAQQQSGQTRPAGNPCADSTAAGGISADSTCDPRSLAAARALPPSAVHVVGGGPGGPAASPASPAQGAEESTTAETILASRAVPPVQPPAGAQFVAWSSEAGAEYYPVACNAWFGHRSNLRWFMTELEARMAGLVPSKECLHAPRYETPRTRSPRPRRETPAPAEPVAPPKPEVVTVTRVESPPPPPIVWTLCEVAFVTGPGSLLCRDGQVVILETPARKGSGIGARDAFARRYPPGTELYVEILAKDRETIRGRVIDRPADADRPTPEPPRAERRGKACSPFHGRWICG